MSTTTYSTGTVSVGAGSTSVTGVGTSWLTSGIRAGDRLVLAGLTARIASVNSNTSITLARGWPGSAQSGADYDIWLEDDGVRSLVAANALLQALGAGTLTSLGALAGAANLMPYFTGAGVMDTTGLTAAARGLLDDADVAAMRTTLELVKVTSDSDVTAGRVMLTGAGPAQAYRRGNILGTVSQTGGVPTGAVIERGSNANGEYVRFADGTQICWKPEQMNQSIAATTYAEVSWTFPAAFSGSPMVTASARSFNDAAGRQNAARYLTGVGGFTGATTGNVGCFNSHSSAVTARVDALAIGRWF